MYGRPLGAQYVFFCFPLKGQLPPSSLTFIHCFCFSPEEQIHKKWLPSDFYMVKCDICFQWFQLFGVSFSTGPRVDGPFPLHYVCRALDLPNSLPSKEVVEVHLDQWIVQLHVLLDLQHAGGLEPGSFPWFFFWSLGKGFVFGESKRIHSFLLHVKKVWSDSSKRVAIFLVNIFREY